MKSKLRSMLAVCLCAGLILCGVGGAITALAAGNEDPQPAVEASAPEKTGAEGAAASGDTLYVIADAAGKTQKVIGGADGDLPVEVSVHYTLDGKEVSPENLAGKSGRVTIRFDYVNNRTETVEVNGKREKILVPVAMLSGAVLDKEKFSNVAVSAGKVLDDGSRVLVMGLAFPGLKEDLALDGGKLSDAGLDLGDSVEITADARDFSLDMTLSVAVDDLFGDLDLGKLEELEDLDDLDGKLDQLTDAVAQLRDGSGRLYDGLETLLEKSGDLAAGVDQLATGSAALKSGAAQVDDGLSSLQGGAAQLAAGLNTLSSNSADLNAGARQVFGALLDTANTQIAAAGVTVPALTMDNYASVLNTAIQTVDDTVYSTALEQVTAAVEAQRPLIREKVAQAVEAEVTAQVTEAVRSQVEGPVAAAVWEAALPQVTEQVTQAVREQVTAQVIQAATGLTPDEYTAAVAAGQVDADTQAAVEAAVAQQLSGEEVQGLIAQQVQAQQESEEIQALVARQVEARMASDEVGQLIAATAAEKLAGEDVQELIDQNTETQVQLVISQQMAGDEVQAKMAAAKERAKPLIGLKASLDSYNAFYLGLQSYTAGVDQLAAGAGSLKAGADQLKSGTGQLSAGAGQLSDGVAQLQGSVPALTQGVTQLRDGAKELRDGVERFDDEGVSKITDLLGGDVTSLVRRLRAVKDAAQQARGQTEGERKAIYRTGSIGA